jgi:predicted AAA+ superfamily ATPase
VVEHWIGELAAKAGLSWERDHELEIQAVRWATGRGNRNGRCAYQFSRYWVGLKMLEQHP